MLIPMKRLDAAKSRLAPALPPQGRRRLMLAMALHVSTEAVAADVGPVALVSSDPQAAGLAASAGVGLLSDAGLPWNDGLRHAIASLEPAAEAVLLLAADLPLLRARDVRALARMSAPGEVVIGRAHDGGTNALLLHPPDAIVSCFGLPGSADEHARRAREAGCRPRLLDLAGVARDIDTPADADRAGIDPAVWTGRSPAARRG